MPTVGEFSITGLPARKMGDTVSSVDCNIGEPSLLQSERRGETRFIMTNLSLYKMLSISQSFQNVEISCNIYLSSSVLCPCFQIIHNLLTILHPQWLLIFLN